MVTVNVESAEYRHQNTNISGSVLNTLSLYLRHGRYFLIGLPEVACLLTNVIVYWVLVNCRLESRWSSSSSHADGYIGSRQSLALIGSPVWRRPSLAGFDVFSA